MSTHKTSYNSNAYDFPNSDLLAYSPEQLRNLIRRELPTTQNQVDGPGSMDQVRIDYAYDLIDQARDLLLDHGQTFSEDEKQELSFLTWPLTKVEQAELEARNEAEEAERKRLYCLVKEVERSALAIAKNAIDGRLEGETDSTRRIRLRIARSGLNIVEGRIVTTGPTGAEVLSLVEELHALGITSAKLGGWACSRRDVTFDADPIPSWAIWMDLPTLPIIWAFLWAWYEKHRITDCPTIEFDWKDGGSPRSNWAYLAHLWPEPQVDAWKVLRAVTPS